MIPLNAGLYNEVAAYVRPPSAPNPAVSIGWENWAKDACQPGGRENALRGAANRRTRPQEQLVEANHDSGFSGKRRSSQELPHDLNPTGSSFLSIFGWLIF